MSAWNRTLTEGNILVVELILIALYQMPLASISDLAVCLGLSPRTLRVHIGQLISQGKVESCILTATRRAAARLHLSEDAARTIGLGYPGWSGPWGRALLLAHLPMAEHFYAVAAQCSENGGVRGFQWIFGEAIDAAARVNDRDWIALIWSGHWETEFHLYDKMLSFHDDLQRMGVSAADPTVPDPSASPTAFVFVTSDRWQAELVRRAAYRAGMTNWVKIYCASTGEWPHGLTSPRISHGWIYWPVPERDLAGWPWEERLDASLSTHPDGAMLYKARDLVTEWPGAGITNLAALAGGERMDRLANGLDALSALQMAESVQLSETSKSGVRYGAASRAISQVAERDRVNRTLSTGSSRAQTWNSEKYQKQRRHEDLVIRIMGAFARKKRPVASGWRCSERFPGGGVNPDGVVFLSSSPFGPGWHYVEVEWRAYSRKKAPGKLERFGSDYRRLFFPGEGRAPGVFFVVKDEEMEQVFHEIGVGIDMLTIPISRWRSNAPMKGWSWFGEIVQFPETAT